MIKSRVKDSEVKPNDINNTITGDECLPDRLSPAAQAVKRLESEPKESCEQSIKVLNEF